jgi:hypothetical protein
VTNSCECGNETSGFNKMRGKSGLAEDLLTPEEGLCPMETRVRILPPPEHLALIPSAKCSSLGARDQIVERYTRAGEIILNCVGSKQCWSCMCWRTQNLI